MKFQEQDIEVLKEFGKVNNHLLFTKGKRIISRSNAGLCIEYFLDDEIKKEFAIGDLNQFNKCLSLIDDGEITLEHNQLVIKNQYSEIILMTYDKSMLNVYDKQIKIPEGITISITKEQFCGTIDAAKQIGLLNIEFYSKDGKIFVQATDKTKRKSTNTYRKIISDYAGKDFSFVFPDHFLTLKKDSYDLFLHEKIAKLSAKSLPLHYYTPPYEDN